jgi:hypothetical protein
MVCACLAATEPGSTPGLSRGAASSSDVSVSLPTSHSTRSHNPLVYNLIKMRPSAVRMSDMPGRKSHLDIIVAFILTLL